MVSCGCRSPFDKLGLKSISIFTLNCLGVLLILYYNVTTDVFSSLGVLTLSSTENLTKESEFLINTGSCAISRTDILPSDLKSTWHIGNVPQCVYEKMLSDLNDDTQILKLRPEFVGKNCCVQEVLPIHKKDNLFTLSKCEKLPETLNVQNKEILVTKCGSNLNFEANFPKTESVQKKLEYWKQYKEPNKPYSVLLIGIDTFSRSHAYRSLPKTVELMKSQMGFVDFKGYHSAAALTIQNFMGFLTGKTMDDVQKTCQHHWNDPYDPCPFIWKNFSDKNYATMYIEDGTQTFSYGYHGGFQKRPTDYYIHSLFQALVPLRKNISGPEVDKISKYKDHLQGCCTSKETVPQFLLRYTRRFTRKFANIPTFAFTWFGYPFHNFEYPIKNFDNDLLNFFQTLNATSDVLRDTLIIFVGDHGVRVRSRKLYRFHERGLPPLFIRLPDRLEHQFPGNNFKEMLQLNSERLTAPYDIHQTFLHLLSFSGTQNDIAHNQRCKMIRNSIIQQIRHCMGFEFKALWRVCAMSLLKSYSSSTTSSQNDSKFVMADRSSLLLPVPLNRTCATIHVHINTCVCNVSDRVNTLSNPFILGKIRHYLNTELNRVVKGSKYKRNCSEWTMNEFNWLLQAQIVKNVTHKLKVLIQFEANPGKSQFEAMLRVNGNPADTKNYGQTEMLGNFSRISLYGNQSSCVQLRTEFDKEMKGLCFCKS